MGLFEHFPYTNFHDLNLDVILQRVKNAETAAASSAEDAAGSQAHADEALTKATNALSTANTAASDAATAKSNAASAVSTANSAASSASDAVTAAQAAQTAAETASTAATGAKNAAISAQGQAETAATNATNAANSASASAASASAAAAATGIKVYDIKYDNDSGKYLADLPDNTQATLDEFLTRIVNGSCKLRIGRDQTDTMTDVMVELFKSPGVDRYVTVMRMIVDTGAVNTRRLYEYSTTIYLDTTPAYYTPINAPNEFNIAVTSV